MKTKKVLRAFLAMLLITVSMIGFCSIPVSAKVSVIFTPPFEDHDGWYTGISGSGTHGNYVWGFLNSPTAFMDYVYKDGIAYVSATGNSVSEKAFWEGACIGWFIMEYIYDESVEIDLNQTLFEYDIEAAKQWLVYLYFEDLNGVEYATPFSLGKVLSVLSDGTYSKEGNHKGSVNMLDAIQRYYLSEKKVWGLTLDSKVRISKFVIGHSDSSSVEPATNTYRKLRIVKDTSQPDIFKPVTTEEPKQTSTSGTTTGAPTTTTALAATTSAASQSQTTSGNPVQGTPLYQQPLFIVMIIITSVILLGAVVLFVLKVLPKIRSKPRND